MKLTIFIFCFSTVILSPHGLSSKSITNNENSNERENSNAQTDVDQSESEETAALHDTYRPRHKYKGVTGHQQRMYRSDVEFERDREPEIRNPQCAVMYKNNEPVGVLQPFEDSFRFLPLNGEPTVVDLNPIPVKRKTLLDVLYPSKIDDDYDDESFDNNEQFTDDRYPSIFAKFKIDSRLDKSLIPDVNMKRPMYKRKSDRADLNEDQVGSLKSTLTKMKSDDSVAVEEELKNILDDMGLIDDYPEKEEAKREAEAEAEAEDENMELGTNRIDLLKDERKEKREKRDEGSSKSTPASSKTSIAHVSTVVAALKKAQFVEDARIDLFNHNEEAKIDDSDNIDSEMSTEEGVELRKKRRDQTKGLKTKDKHKRDLETTDLNECTTPNLAEEGEMNEYEKRVEREIRDKIEKLKDEVKKEISELNLKQTGSDATKKAASSDANIVDQKRSKRQVVNTLMDEETADIDPTLNIDGRMVNHVRRKKSVTFKDFNSGNNTLDNANTVTKREGKINIYPGVNINGRDRNIRKAILKRFIGISPILENVNCSKYHTRALKQYNLDPNGKNVENQQHIRVKRQEIDKDLVKPSGVLAEEPANGAIVRKKRQAEDEMEDGAYQYDDSQFGEEMAIDNLNTNNNKQSMNDPATPDRVEVSQYAGASKTCNCDKNGNNCKCGKQSVEPDLPTFREDYLDYNNIIQPSENVAKKSIGQTHCNCGKDQNHCKCGHLFEDAPEPLNRDYSNDVEQQPTTINDKPLQSEKQALNEKAPLREKESVHDESSDDKGPLNNYPFEAKFRRKNVLDPSEREGYLPSREEGLAEEYDNYETGEGGVAKRETKSKAAVVNEPFQNGEYFVDLHPDVYRLTPVDSSREKRENFNRLVAIHGGGPVRNHLVAIKQRSMMPHSRFRRRVQNDDNRELRQLIDMSDVDLFGALPQSFEGELARYKRVKRAKAEK